MEDKYSRYLVQLTGQEFVDLLREGLALSASEESTPSQMKEKKHYVYGYQGLRELLGVTDTAVWRLLKSGVIDAAVSKHGKIIVTDADLALDLLKIHKQRVGKIRGGYSIRNTANA